MITVRNAVPDDDEGVAIVCASGLAILRAVYRPSPQAFSERAKFDEILSRLVALVDDKVVGTVQYFFETDVLRLIGLMVRVDYHRKGIARALVARLDDIAIKAGRSKLVARTIKETNNVPVFQRLGFAIEGERPDTLFVSDRFASLTEVDLGKPAMIRTNAEAVPPNGP